MNRVESTATFSALRKVLAPFARNLVRVIDTDSRLYLNTRKLQADGKPFFFGGIQVNKGGVSFHLMPIYTHPQLLRGASPALRKKLKGKSCFTFTAPDPVLLKELAKLTKAGFEQYRKAGHA